MHSVLLASTECYPYAKVGGMADVVGALPKYLEQLDWAASVILPVYDRPLFHGHFEVVFRGRIQMDFGEVDFEIRNYGRDYGYHFYGVHAPNLFFRESIYLAEDGHGYRDEVLRNVVFQRAILTWWNHDPALFNLLHCHDHMTGLMPFLMRHGDDYKNLRHKPTMMTIHNALYRGRFSWDLAPLLGPYDTWKWGLLDWSHEIDSLACGLKCADLVNVVSPQYLKELTSSGHDLQWIFDEYPDKFIGLINGIDYEVWDPEEDEAIVVRKTGGIASFKKKNKAALTSHFKDKDLPLFCFIGRFAHQKGVDVLIAAIREELYAEARANFIILGSGDKTLEHLAIQLQNDYPDNVFVELGYNEDYSHQLYAGSDFLLMPSRVEPCGLNQMLAMRYGTLVVAHATGGLVDTVPDIEDGGYGITFSSLTTDNLIAGIRKGVQIFEDKKKLSRLRNKVIKLDFSWKASAEQYAKEYLKLIEGE